MDLIVNQAIELKQLNRNMARLLSTRIAVAGDWESRFAAVESLIAERVLPAATRAAGTFAVWNKLEASDGLLRLGSLASEVECSHRHLVAQFRANVGLPPKTVARLFRFNRAVQVVNRLGRNVSDTTAGKPYIDVPRLKHAPPRED
jgi:hypothetical protein